METLQKKIESINTKESFIEFLNLLIVDLKQNSDTWENKTLDRYLEAMSSWIEDMNGYYQNRNEPVPSNISWKVYADILMASKIYE